MKRPAAAAAPQRILRPVPEAHDMGRPVYAMGRPAAAVNAMGRPAPRAIYGAARPALQLNYRSIRSGGIMHFGRSIMCFVVGQLCALW